MMEHINIITQEVITKPLAWPVVVVGCIGIAFAIGALIWSIIGQATRTYVEDHCVNLLSHAACMIPIMFVTMAICSIFFRVETDMYKYTGTIDDEISAVEFAEFYATYDDIKFIDGVWMWEDKE